VGGELCASSIDTMVEGVHFRLSDGWATPQEVGHRAMAGALSDLAAVGAAPGEAFISMGLPPGFAEQHALELALGADALAVETGTAIAGGDVVASPVLFVSVAVTGWLGAGEQPLTRAGASPGDLVGVTGELGAAAALLAALDGRAPGVLEAEPGLERARWPVPRLAEGRALGAAGASAAIDLSDGLAADAAALGSASGVSLALEAELLPLSHGVTTVAERLDISAAALGAAGGEDYELCFCAPPARRDAVEAALAGAGTARLTWIGEAREGLPGARLLDRRGDVVRAEGYEHRW
jgi:thiamine-monophosphate kinase